MKVTMYKSDDGKLHDSFKACEFHNARLKAVPQLNEFFNQGETDEKSYTASEVSFFIYENMDKLMEVLAPLQKPKERKPRKSKNEVAITPTLDETPAQAESKPETESKQDEGVEEQMEF